MTATKLYVLVICVDSVDSNKKLNRYKIGTLGGKLTDQLVGKTEVPCLVSQGQEGESS